MQNFNRSSTHIYTITTSKCGETGRITALSDDVPGLIMEVDHVDEIAEIAQDLVPDLLELNNVHDERSSLPVRIDNTAIFYIHVAKGEEL